MKQLIHYILNTGRMEASQRTSQKAIDRLRPLALTGGPIPGRPPFHVRVDRGTGSALFSILWNANPVVTCGLAWTNEGSEKIWPLLETLYFEVSDLLISTQVDRTLGAMISAEASKPSSLPWLGIVPIPTKSKVAPPDISWLPAFERALAWTIMAPAPAVTLSNAACDKLWKQAHRAGADGRVDEAAVIFRRLLTVRPNDSEYALGLGRSLRELGQYDEALQALEWAGRLNPADHLTQHEIGIVFAATSRWAEAAEKFRKVLSMPPDGRTDIREYAQHSLGVCTAKLQSLPGEE